MMIKLLILSCLITTALAEQLINIPAGFRDDILPNEHCINATRALVDQTLCPPSQYRTTTGQCNNIRNERWGTRGDRFIRLFDAVYGDGVGSPRRASDDSELPSPRKILSVLESSPHLVTTAPHISALFPLWGDLVYHDIATMYAQGSNKSCCKDEEDLSLCYVTYGANCKEYTRTVTRDTCNLSKQREQVNGASSFLDGSAIYGEHYDEMMKIRLFKNGLLDINSCDKCKEYPLGVLFTIFYREHNRLARDLALLKPNWNDETLFYETRKLVIGEIQHITFNEFVPALLGKRFAESESLKLIREKFYSHYSSKNRPGTFNEAAAAAFPLFRSLIPDIGKSNLDSLVQRPASTKINMAMPKEATKEWNSVELAIHRSRDHGIPPYVKAMNVCAQFSDVFGESFSDFKRREVLHEMYKNVEDVDFLVGAMLEEPQGDAIFGPTLTCLFALQFIKIRNSDRFWYENDIPPSSLTLNNLKAVRATTLSGLLCANGLVRGIQPMAFYLPDPYLNAPIDCRHLQGLQLVPGKRQRRPNNVNTNFREEKKESTLSYEDLNSDILRKAFERAKDKLNERRRLEYELFIQNGGGIDARSPDGTAASFSKANRNALLIANSSLFYEIASNEILAEIQGHYRRKRQTFEGISTNLQFIDVNSLVSGSISPVSMEPQCEDFSAPCDTKTPFRTLTGHCNNLKNPTLGQSLTIFSRLLPAVYEDGISAPRVTSVTGTALPNPRVISSLIHPDISNLHTRYSMMVMQFAQFVDHDLTMTPIHKGFHESIPSCRSCDSANTVHPECNPIPIPSRDHYYPELNITDGNRFCFPFMRSLPGQQTLGPREQINQNTAFLDASQVYGENTCICRKLRGFSGRLNSTAHPYGGKELLPQSPVHPECKSESGYCFIAGDGRASEQPGLTVIHTIFMREHNRLVEGLRGVNPHWDGEKLFDHARRINVAINQHITYNEFLPRILSWNAVNLYGLKLLPQGYYTEYNPTCNPAIVTEFASAAYRIGHSLLRPHIPRINAQHQPVDPPILLRDGFFKTDNLLQPGMVDEISRGLVATPMETLDQFITGEVTNHLFEDRKIPFSGVDLVALNVQRARDHGIPSYNHYRALCNLKRAQTWEDLSREIPPEVIARFKRIYASVDDIDLFPGGLSERPLQGGLVGPTFACIIAIQFRQLRKCDRFWYENNDPAIRFTEAQLAEIRKVTLAKVFCENLDNPGEMQRAAFDLPSNFLNPRVSCDSMPQIDLNAWRENTQGCTIGGKSVRVGDSAFPTPCTSCICLKEGPQCASLRITDCAQLAREWPRDTILRDDVCSAQCGLALSTNTQQVRLNPPPAPQVRSARSRTLNFEGFTFPDLTKFLG